MIARNEDLPAADPRVTFHIIPDGAIMYVLRDVAFTTLRGGRYVALPDAINALREIILHGDDLSRDIAKKGLSGWT